MDKYFRTFIISFVIITIVSFSFYISLDFKNEIISGYLGYFLSSLNFAGGFLAIKLSFNKPFNIFMGAIFGGMIIRLCFTLLIIFIILKFFDIRAYIFIFVIFVSYIFYLIFEVLYLNLIKGSQSN